MRHPIQPLPISPKLLKHFAAATVVLTGLIALFAGGEQSQVAQELAAREERNKLVQTEAEVIGTREIGERETTRTKGSWGSDGPENAGFTGGSTDPNGPPMLTARPPRGMAGGVARPRGVPVGDQQDEMRSDAHEPTGPTADQAAALLESSRARSGSTGDGD